MTNKTAPANAAHDSVKALEGLFNGLVTRIAYALKDPLNFGPNTKTILIEVAKKFHDTLDDCEIQLLDAKWFLENHLAQNKLAREARARQKGTAVKRKHSEAPEEQREEAIVTKKARLEDDVTEVQPVEPKEGTDPVDKVTDDLAEKTDNEPVGKGEKEDEPSKKNEDVQTLQDDFSKPTPQATPANTNDFNFSMFGDPQGDGENEELNFDLGMDENFEDLENNNNNQNPNSLDTLLPGLGDYANQAGENTGTAAGSGDALPPFPDDFALPEIGGTNEFDDFLNDDSLDDSNFGGKVDLSEKALMDMQFDENMFN